MSGFRLFLIGAALLAALLSKTEFGNAVAIGISIGLVLIGLNDIRKNILQKGDANG